MNCSPKGISHQRRLVVLVVSCSSWLGGFRTLSILVVSLVLHLLPAMPMAMKKVKAAIKKVKGSKDKVNKTRRCRSRRSV